MRTKIEQEAINLAKEILRLLDELELRPGNEQLNDSLEIQRDQLEVLMKGEQPHGKTR